MTPSEVRSAIEAAIGAVPFEPPVSLEYCAAVRDVLRAALPGAHIDAYHRFVELVVEVHLGDLRCLVATPLV